MAHRSNQIVHTDEKRHKCHLCGAVRYEARMVKMDYMESDNCSQFGNDKKCWKCRGTCIRPVYRAR
jgi:hypothetical protein